MIDLRPLRDAPVIDMRPMSLDLKHALIAMDIELELLKAKADKGDEREREGS